MSLDVDGRKILHREKIKQALRSESFLLNKLHSPLATAMGAPILFVLLLLFGEDGGIYSLTALAGYVFLVIISWLYKLQTKLNCLIELLEIDREDDGGEEA